MKYGIPSMFWLVLLISGMMQLRAERSLSGSDDTAGLLLCRWSGYALLAGAACAAAVDFFA